MFHQKFKRQTVNFTKIHNQTFAVICGISKLQTAEGLDLSGKQGRNHDLAVVLSGVILAVLCHRDGNLSSVWRHRRNNYVNLLQHLPLENYDCGVVSRLHLPIILSKVSGAVFDRLIFAEYGIKLSKRERKWFAVDNKERTGSIKKGEKRGETVVHAVEPETEAIQGQNYYAGNKESERVTLSGVKTIHA